ncbi:MAG: RNA-binding transcriptional accessory protein [Bacteriovoracaceae bacterium]|nr:RNA-binding transcriptional accessory protein [Deltaproteobacteria bacterium]NLW67396.1 RNA-binding transcriptional accessory protein [Bacteriovoracaceae bacterium]
MTFHDEERPVSRLHYSIVARELGIAPGQVRAAATLLAEGATVPFIARYRKELTGSLDEVAVTAVRDRLAELEALDARKETVLRSLTARGMLTEDLGRAVAEAQTLPELEDVYLPYRPKRRTRAAIAREKGLEPLADAVFLQEGGMDPVIRAQEFVSPEKGVDTPEDALAGARDIIAERISEDPGVRAALRALFEKHAVIESEVYAGAEEQAAIYRDYFSWREKAASAPGHRILAMLRGSREALLRLSVRPDEDKAIDLLQSMVCSGSNPCTEQVRLAAADGYRRLLAPSLENEMKGSLKERADDEAIGVFARNLRELLMAPPLGGKRVLAIDPGFRTGCKVVCLDAQGKLLHHDVIYPVASSGKKAEEAGLVVRGLAERFDIEVVAVGNGTAGRETERFVRGLGLPATVVMVSESGASVYSASETARREFPDHDVTVRGAVSIGRRLMDPLAELVKIDPKSIGVGQYQHDVDQAKLRRKLDDVVQSCVNAVGVEVNTASPELLAYVSGLGPVLAGNIVTYREKNGPFESREALKKVPRLGEKAFELSAGFLRIRGGSHPLDASAVHPERYGLVERMARDLGCSLSDLMHDRRLRERIDLGSYVDASVGMPTLKDILSELDKPGRDPRESFEEFSFAEGVTAVEDLRPGMELPGIVTNVTNFGAFVDIGVHQDGLVHISQLADRFVKDPTQVVSVGGKVRVRVLEVDTVRRRISLSMRKPRAKT